MNDDPTLWQLFLERPIEATLSTLGPLAIATALVGNAVVHDLPTTVPMTYALVLVAFAVVVSRHHLARVRLLRLQSSTGAVESSSD